MGSSLEQALRQPQTYSATESLAGRTGTNATYMQPEHHQEASLWGMKLHSNHSHAPVAITAIGIGAALRCAHGHRRQRVPRCAGELAALQFAQAAWARRDGLPNLPRRQARELPRVLRWQCCLRYLQHALPAQTSCLLSTKMVAVLQPKIWQGPVREHSKYAESRVCVWSAPVDSAAAG